jgi:hypothetical protein
MVYSSPSGRAPRGAASLEVTAAQLFCDAHHVRGAAVGVSRPMFSCMFERLSWRRVWDRVKGIRDFQSSEAAVDSTGHTDGDWCWSIDCVAAARHLRL